MDTADVLIFAILAMVHISLLVTLRLSRRRRMRVERLKRSLQLALRRENAIQAIMSQERWSDLRRAS